MPLNETLMVDEQVPCHPKKKCLMILLTQAELKPLLMEIIIRMPSMLAKVRGNNKEEQTDERRCQYCNTDRYLTSVIMCSEIVCNM